MTAKKNLLVLCLLSASGALSPIANGLELVNVPEPTRSSLAAPTPHLSVEGTSVPQLNVKHSGSGNLDARSLLREGQETVVGVRSLSPVQEAAQPSLPAAKHSARKNNTLRLQEVGVAESSKVASFGNDVPFHTALTLMLPEGWSIHLAESLRSSEKRVSWREGEDRMMALTRILNNHPQVRGGRINWDSKSLFVFDKPISPAGQTVWHVTSGKSLRSTLSEWAAFEGWTLVWDPKHDFMLGASARYQGSLSHATEQLIGATSRANKSLDVNFWEQNRVIHVSERKGARL